MGRLGLHRRAVSELAPQQAMSGRPDVLPGTSDVMDSAQERLVEAEVRRKDSVARMTWDGLSYVVTVSV